MGNDEGRSWYYTGSARGHFQGEGSIVAQLSDPDPQRRIQAAEQIVGLGPAARPAAVNLVKACQRIELAPDSVYTVDDPQDLLHREPLVASFRVRGPPPHQAFTFTLVNIRTDPDETDTELDALADVFLAVQRAGNEDDVVLLGDLHVDEYHLGRLGQLPGIRYAVTGTTTNTRRDKMYDNLVFDGRKTTEYTRQWGVLDLITEYGLSEEAALECPTTCRSGLASVFTSLGMAGIWQPKPAGVRHLCTKAAKSSEVIRWADGRATFEVIPEMVERDWGIDTEGWQ